MALRENLLFNLLIVRKMENQNQTPNTYTVVKGDSLSKISQKFYGDAKKWKVIYEANKSVIGSNPDLIHPGQVYVIP